MIGRLRSSYSSSTHILPARRAVKELGRYLKVDVAVGPYLADQLLFPMPPASGLTRESGELRLVRSVDELNGAHLVDTTTNSRQFSLCLAMQTILHCGPISRASIAKQTGLSKQTISEVVRCLELDGWIRETGRTSGHIGRSAVTYEIVADAACIAAVDLGGTKLRVAIADLAGTTLSECVEPTDPVGGVNVVHQIARLCGAAARESGVGPEKIKLAVVGVPGVPDLQHGRIHMAPNIPGVDQFDVKAALADALGLDILLENDVNLAALGEHWIGCGAGLDDLAFIALGTGIGAGIIVRGELVRGAGHAAGELGFLPFGADPIEPESLRVGTLERVIATSGMRMRYRALAGRDLMVPEIFDAAAVGDRHAVTVLDDTARYLAHAIAAICAVVNPGRVILGGSIGRRRELADRVRVEVARCFPNPIDVELSMLGSRAALAGAAAVGLTHLHTSLFAGGMKGASIGLPGPKLVSFMEAVR